MLIPAVDDNRGGTHGGGDVDRARHGSYMEIGRPNSCHQLLKSRLSPQVQVVVVGLHPAILS